MTIFISCCRLQKEKRNRTLVMRRNSCGHNVNMHIQCWWHLPDHESSCSRRMEWMNQLVCGNTWSKYKKSTQLSFRIEITNLRVCPRLNYTCATYSIRRQLFESVTTAVRHLFETSNTILFCHWLVRRSCRQTQAQWQRRIGVKRNQSATRNYSLLHMLQSV